MPASSHSPSFDHNLNLLPFLLCLLGAVCADSLLQQPSGLGGLRVVHDSAAFVRTHHGDRFQECLASALRTSIAEPITQCTSLLESVKCVCLSRTLIVSRATEFFRLLSLVPEANLLTLFPSELLCFNFNKLHPICSLL